MRALSITRLFARRPVAFRLRSSRLREPFLRPFTLKHERARSVEAYDEDEANQLKEPISNNPYDEIGRRRRRDAEVRKLKREIKFLFIGLAFSMAGTYACSCLIEEDIKYKKGHSADANPRDTEAFQGKPVVLAAGGQKLVVEDPSTHEQIELVPTGTSYVPHFPKIITLPSGVPGEKDPEYTLIGLGIRRVSFLNVQVYVVGLYVKNSSLAPLQASLVHHINPMASALIPGEKEELRTSLLDPESSSKIWEAVLQDGHSQIETAFRVVPVRDTNFNHLRDGWVTGLTNRIQEASQKAQNTIKDAGTSGQSTVSEVSEFDDDSMALSMREFKQIFQGRGKAPKGSIILLTRDGRGILDVLYQKNPAGGEVERIGRLEDERISRLLWLLYLGGKKPSSEEARKDVVSGVMAMVERPVGTVETQVV
ncbi:hypothetical protein EJ05DRAFT_538294 [Pseudovirgaria hyperparasitica]|uniref:Chalcone isomerase domain-containing protein n=1 Tax=Pseudovirgaria hyperparasitica TaxID=470096 RepID=A0A6A6WAA1_9PEZI|nr:uncharacterized protein EJ05DRAFT_538294 [Pseudovirgaria hyperparasitica]KAF2758041.1 hypothetical protein EJ05DRAFT_538294 [Pseudovirgaria hyperparasitica]